MATGARMRDILQQFLTEAMTLSGIGGIIGVALGNIIATIIPAHMKKSGSRVVTVLLPIRAPAARVARYS